MTWPKPSPLPCTQNGTRLIHAKNGTNVSSYSHTGIFLTVKVVCHGYRSSHALKEGENTVSAMTDIDRNIFAWAEEALRGDFESISVRMLENSDAYSDGTPPSQEQIEDDRRNFHMVKDYYQACTASEEAHGQYALNHFLDGIFHAQNKTSVKRSTKEFWQEPMVGMLAMSLESFVQLFVVPSQWNHVRIASQLYIQLTAANKLLGYHDNGDFAVSKLWNARLLLLFRTKLDKLFNHH